MPDGHKKRRNKYDLEALKGLGRVGALVTGGALATLGIIKAAGLGTVEKTPTDVRETEVVQPQDPETAEKSARTNEVIDGDLSVNKNKLSAHVKVMPSGNHEVELPPLRGKNPLRPLTEVDPAFSDDALVPPDVDMSQVEEVVPVDPNIKTEKPWLR